MPWDQVVGAAVLVAVLVTGVVGRTGPAAVMLAGLVIGIAGVVALVIAFVVGFETIDGRSSDGLDLLFVGSVTAIAAGAASWVAGVVLWLVGSVIRTAR